MAHIKLTQQIVSLAKRLETEATASLTVLKCVKIHIIAHFICQNTGLTGLTKPVFKGVMLCFQNMTWTYVEEKFNLAFQFVLSTLSQDFSQIS